MRRLASLFRVNNKFQANAQLVRGPKKKKEAELKVQSNDIINIFKDRADPELLELQHYPTFVQQFALGTHSYYEIDDGVSHDISYKRPNQSTYKSYIRAIKRQRCKMQNQYIHIYKNLDINDESKDVNNRTLVYNVFAKSEEQIKEEERKAAQEDLQDDDDDDF